MRRAILTGAAALAATCAFGTGVAGAQTGCQLPKGWYTSAAQLQYDLYTESGFMGTRIQRYIPPPGSSIDMHNFLRRTPYNAVDIGTGTVTSVGYLAQAALRFVDGMAMATVNEPPSCSSKQIRSPGRHTRPR